MKNFIKILLLLIVSPLTSFAQITIDSSDIDPIGFWVIQSRDSTVDASSIAPGGTGMQTWDFSQLDDEDRDTLTFYAPSETNYFSEFPQANIAATVDSQLVPYFQLNSSSFNLLGSHAKLAFGTFNISAPYRFSPPQKLLEFPVEYGDNFEQTTRFIITVTGAEIGQPYDSVRLVTNSVRNVSIDGFGTMTIPIGTFDVLRFKEVETSIDSIYVNNGVWIGIPDGNTYTTTRYKWWTNQNGIGSPIVQLEYRQSLDTSAVFINDYVSSTHNPKNLFQVTISPNPAYDQVRAELPEGFTGTIEIYDMNGRLAHRSSTAGSVENIDLKACAAGHHILVLKDKNGKLAGFQRFQVAR